MYPPPMYDVDTPIYVTAVAIIITIALNVLYLGWAIETVEAIF